MHCSLHCLLVSTIMVFDPGAKITAFEVQAIMR